MHVVSFLVVLKSFVVRADEKLTAFVELQFADPPVVCSAQVMDWSVQVMEWLKPITITVNPGATVTPSPGMRRLELGLRFSGGS